MKIPGIQRYEPVQAGFSRNQFVLMSKRFARNRMAVGALAFLIVLIVCTMLADYITPYSYTAQDLTNRLQFPSFEHWMGTDDFGRDILTRVLRGGQVSLLVSLLAVGISTAFAVVLGCIAGYFGGLVDNAIMRVMDVFIAIPGLLLSMTISAALGPGLMNTAIALAVGAVAPLARQLRSSIMLLQGQEYIEASKAFGAGSVIIILKHIIPNTMAPLIVQISLRLGDTIMAIAGLSFLGLGVQPPIPEWGNMVADGRETMRVFWPSITFPGVAVALTMLAFNLLGDGVRDAMDPRMKR
jgi:peptide/nickel transport system permease protein